MTSKLERKTVRLAESFIGKFVVYAGDVSQGVFKCLGWTTSGFRLRAVRFAGHEELSLRTRKMRLASDREIADACAMRLKGEI